MPPRRKADAAKKADAETATATATDTKPEPKSRARSKSTTKAKASEAKTGSASPKPAATPKAATPKAATPKAATAAAKAATPKNGTAGTPKRTPAAGASEKKPRASRAKSVSGGGATSVIPAWARFPAVAASSFALASLGYALLGAVTGGELAARSRLLETWGEVAVLAGWRLVELAVGWYWNLDSLDVATLNLLSHGPPLYLLTTFYEVSPVTALLSYALDVASAAVPFHALRPLSAVHTRTGRLPNRELAGASLQLYTATLATAVYTVAMTLALRLALPRALAVWFVGIPTLAPAYEASYLALLPAGVLFGAAASSFIYAPFATTGRAKDDDRIAQFDPAAASLRETVAWNFLGYTAKTKVVVGRTAVAVAVTALNTFLATRYTVFGVEAEGAAAYAGAWAVSTALVGAALAFAGGHE